MIEFRAWDKTNKKMKKVASIDFYNKFAFFECLPKFDIDFCEDFDFEDIELLQYIGIKDKKNEKYFIGDIGEFENGDRFVLRMEDWIEVYIEWIGEPECEDLSSTNDLYRIEEATIIGNAYEQTSLLKPYEK